MSPFPVLPDVEAMVIAFLNAKLTPPVSGKVPNPRPATFVRAFRTGGAATNRVVDRAQVTVQAWAPDTVAASQLAQLARTALFNEYTAMSLVRRVEEVAGLYYDPDPTSHVDRYTFTIILTVRAGR